MAGSLVCVGTGMMLGGHMTPRARHEIEHADIVYALVTNVLFELWLRELNPRLESLQSFYQEGVSRRQTYDNMVDRLVATAEAGQRVCGAFYGHPGVFAKVPHEAVRLARAKGLSSYIEPGISAEDCLYAELGLDPGDVGVQHFEATQFMLYRRRVDPTSLLVLWQVGVCGDVSFARRQTGATERALLVQVLLRDYPPQHEVILYRAATLPLESAVITRFALADLPQAVVDPADTLVLPPALPLVRDQAMQQRLSAIGPVVKE